MRRLLIPLQALSASELKEIVRSVTNTVAAEMSITMMQEYQLKVQGLVYAIPVTVMLLIT
jgi:outer membrane lipopolysaccharide assembly protein LptE/RlpB